MSFLGEVWFAKFRRLIWFVLGRRIVIIRGADTIGDIWPLLVITKPTRDT